MWWQTLIPILVDVIRLLLERRVPVMFGADAGPADTDQAERLANQLEQTAQELKAANVKGQPVGHPGSLFQHVTELVAALRAGNWDDAGRLAVEILTFFFAGSL